MITRTTTVGTLKSYRYNLNVANNNMAKSMNTVITRRQFNSYAEDPALATRCFQIRRSFLRVNSQLTVNESTHHKYDVAWQALDSVTTDLYKITDDTAYTSIIRGLNDPDDAGHNALGQSMVAKAQSMVQTMNTRYGENYVFAGADHMNVPFTWEAKKNPDYIDPDVAKANPDDYPQAFPYEMDDGTLTYDAASAEPVPEDNPDYSVDITDPDDPNFEKPYLDKNGQPTDDPAAANMVPKPNPQYDPKTSGKYLTETGEGTNYEKSAETVLCYRGVPVDEMSGLGKDQMDYFVEQETRNMDLGLGFKEKDGEAVSSSVFDAALQGVYYLGGYGMEKKMVTVQVGETSYEKEMELPNNVISIVNRMGKLLLNCSPENGRWASAEEEAEFYALAQKFEDTISLVGQRYDELDTEAAFLRDNTELLSGTAYSLNEQLEDLEAVDPAAAISDYMFARYVYDAALKVGNSVLSQSLMDYMSF